MARRKKVERAVIPAGMTERLNFIQSLTQYDRDEIITRAIMRYDRLVSAISDGNTVVVLNKLGRIEENIEP